MPEVRLGVDVGGTFTDFRGTATPETGSFYVGKALTTPQDLAVGISTWHA